VDAFDGSTEMAKVSSENTGQTTRVMTFESLDLPTASYDGIWAMASLLHVLPEDLPGVLVKLGQALKPNGVLLATFKEGVDVRVDDKTGRRFTDVNAQTLQTWMSEIEGFQTVGIDHQVGADFEHRQTYWFTLTLRRVPEQTPELKSSGVPKKRTP